MTIDKVREEVAQHRSSPFYSDGYFAGLNGQAARDDMPAYVVGYAAGERARTLFQSHGMVSTGRNSFGGRIA